MKSCPRQPFGCRPGSEGTQITQKKQVRHVTVIWRDAAREGDVKDKRSFKTFEKYGDAKEFENSSSPISQRAPYKAPSDHTLKEIATRYLEAGAGAGRFRVIWVKRGHDDKYISPKLGHRKMTEIKFPEIERACGTWTQAAHL